MSGPARWIHWLPAVLLMLLGFTGAPAALASGVVTICTEGDLRAAMAGGGTVTFGCDGTIVVSNTLTLSGVVSLDATGHRVTLSGGRARPVVYVTNGARVAFRQLTIADGLNSQLPAAGVINYGTLDVAQCTLASNVSVGVFDGPTTAGAIFNGGTLRVSDSTFVGNQTVAAGSGIASFYPAVPQRPQGPLTVVNCTFYGNSCGWGSTVIAYNATVSNVVESCTFVGDLLAVGGPLNLRNSILSGGSAGNCSAILDGGYNLSSDNSCGFTHPQSRNNVDPLLGTFADHGGPTRTVALLAGSPALDAGGPNGPAFDQRGYVRPYGGAPDIGAYESATVGTNPGTFALSVAGPVHEDGGEILVTVQRTGGTFGPASVNFATVNGTATTGTDFVATNGTLSFASGEPQKTFSVRVLDDEAVESDETFEIALSGASGAALGEPATLTVTVIDDETPALVTSCDEAGLRAALAARRTVRFACDGTIPLTETLRVTSSVRLEGAGHAVTLSGSNRVRLFLIEPGARLRLAGLHLVDGLAKGVSASPSAPADDGAGGAVLNLQGTLQASNCVFHGNVAIGGPSASAGLGSGGAIFNAGGTVWLQHCVLSSNRAEGRINVLPGIPLHGGQAQGGALANAQGTVYAIGTTFSENQAITEVVGSFNARVGAPGFGGAFYNDGEAEFVDCRLGGNRTVVAYANRAAGGGVFQRQGTLKMGRCLVASNAVFAGFGVYGTTSSGTGTGGGICVDGGVVSLDRSTFTGNSAVGGEGVTRGGGQSTGGSGQGGGVFNAGAAAGTNCTFNGNLARGGGGIGNPAYSGAAEGGAIYNAETGRLELTHVTLAGDAARLAVLPAGNPSPISVARGGEIASAGSVIHLRNSILANSLSGGNWFGAGLIDEGNNLSSDLSCPWTAAGSRAGVDPVLGPLTDYGDGLLVMTLLAGSPAIDAGSAAACTATDQRGRRRPFGAACDIGAFEFLLGYTIKGQITGYLPPTRSIVVVSPLGAAVADSSGRYELEGLPAGQHLVTPTSPEIVFVHSNRLVDVTADIAGVNFHAYRSNALVIDKVSGPAARLVYAGEAGATYRLLTSTNFFDWVLDSTATAASSGLIETNVPVATPPWSRSFRVVRP